jgi:hypothetical protein
MAEDDWNWGTKETAHLSQRMVYRLAKRVLKQNNARAETRKEMPVRDMIKAGLGQYDLNRPDWYPEKADLALYDDDWDDWTEDEVAVLKRRLNDRHPGHVLFVIFRVPKEIADFLEIDTAKPEPAAESAPSAGETEPTKEIDLKSSEPAKYDFGRFSRLDFRSEDDHRFANRRWTEYEERIDLDKPANQTTVEMMITMEVEFRRARRDCASPDSKVQTAAFNRLKSVQTAYSKAAADVAQLEKQFKLEPEQESLDAVIERTHDIREGWRDTQIENEMGLRGLFDLVEKFHRTHLEEDDEDAEPKEIKIPKPRTKPTRDIKAEIALTNIEKSEGEDIALVVGSDG